MEERINVFIPQRAMERTIWILFAPFLCFAQSQVPCSVRHSANLIITYDPPVSEEDLFNTRIPHDTRVRYACERGYQVIGVTEARCNHGSYGRSSVPYCEPVQCPEEEVAHGRLTYVAHDGSRKRTTPVHGDTRRLRCNTGYKSTDFTRSLCDNEVWVNEGAESLRCLPKTCTVDRLYNGVFPGRRITYNHGENITFSCNLGFEKEYESYWCDRGTALPANPQCVQASCNAPDLPDHMISSQYRFAHGSLLSVSCEHGFRLSANHQQPRCWYGVWSRSLDVTCQRVRMQRLCSKPGYISRVVQYVNGLEINELTSYPHDELPEGTFLTSHCSLPGQYVLQGSANRTCSEGRWTGVEPRCVASETRITFQNNQPLEIRSDGTIVIFPRSYMRIECRVPSNKVAHFASDSGVYGHYWANYRLSFMAMTLNPPRTSQSGRFTCRSRDNSLSHSVFIQFTAIHCDRPGVPTNGTLHDYDFGWRRGRYYMGKVVTYTCNRGYSLDGERRIKCVFGQWSDPVPTCRAHE